MEHIKLIYITMFVTHNWVSISIIKHLLGNSFTTYTEYATLPWSKEINRPRLHGVRW